MVLSPVLRAMPLVAPGSPASPVVKPHNGSLVVVDRHVHKTGGTTVRTIFQGNAFQGRCMYWGYAVRDGALREVIDQIKQSNASMRLCVEQHMADNVPLQHAALSELRERGQLFQTTRVRDPFDYYLSYYKWAVVGHHLSGQPGLDFLEWAPRDLQANMLLRPKLSPRVEAGDSSVLHFDDDDYSDVVGMLDDYELVGTTERFAEFAVLLKQGTGLEVHYQQEVPEQRELPEGHALVSDEDVCPDMDKCREHVRQLTPYDQQLYDRYSTKFEKLVEQGGDELAAATQNLKDLATASGGWYGGEPRPKKCGWLNVERRAPEYGFDDDGKPLSCLPVSTEVGTLIQASVAGEHTVDPDNDRCCLNFGPLPEVGARLGAGLAARLVTSATPQPRPVDLEAGVDGFWHVITPARAAALRNASTPLGANFWLSSGWHHLALSHLARP